MSEPVYVRGQWVDIEVERVTDLARARAASEAVTIATLRDEINVLRAELAQVTAERDELDTLLVTRQPAAMLPDPTTHTHDGIRRDHTIPVRYGYRDVGI